MAHHRANPRRAIPPPPAPKPAACEYREIQRRVVERAPARQPRRRASPWLRSAGPARASPTSLRGWRPAVARLQQSVRSQSLFQWHADDGQSTTLGIVRRTQAEASRVAVQSREALTNVLQAKARALANARAIGSALAQTDPGVADGEGQYIPFPRGLYLDPSARHRGL